MKQSLQITLLALVLIISSCEKRCRKKDGKFTIGKESYKGSLKTHGYYYYFDADDNGFDVFVLYTNGLVLGTHPSDLTIFEQGISKEPYKNAKPGWGLFLVNNFNIQIDDWGNGNGCEYPAYTRLGEILNDSTFLLKEYYKAQTKDGYLKLNDTFRFKQTPTKPDSTQPYL